MDNYRQIAAIHRYHHHLRRLGRTGGLEQTARLWIVRYACLWRQHLCRSMTTPPTPRRRPLPIHSAA